MGDERPPPAGPGRPPAALPPLWLPLWLLLLLTAAGALPRPAAAICPSKCVCDDDVLRASCELAGLEVVPIQLNPEVRAIRLQGNRIVSLHRSFSFYMNLRWLDLSRNRVASLGAHVFEYQEKLEHLNVSGNEVKSLSKDAFRGLRSLRVLDLSENLLRELPAGALADTPDLAELYLASNQLIAIADRAFERLGQLRVLRLDSNQLLEVPAGALRRLPALKQLGLAGNLISELGEDALPPLRDLRSLLLQDNDISRVHRAAFDGVPALQLLDLSDNNLTAVPTPALAKLSKLAELDLSYNAIAALEPVAFQSLFELRRLRVSRLRRLHRIDPRAFADNVRLESVSLDDNGLTSLPARLFHDRRALVEISVRENRFTSLDASQFPLDQLRVLQLADNPLHCNCSLLWLWLLTRRQLELEARNLTASNSSPDATPRLDVDAIRCAEPEPLRNTLVGDVPEAAVRCDASWLSVIIVAIVVLALFAGTCGLLLLVGTGRWCKREDEESEAAASLPAHSHLQNGTVLMLMTGKESADPMDGVVLRAAKDAPWAPPPRIHTRFPPPDAWDAPCKETAADLGDPGVDLPPYHLNGATPRKPAHIVYV